MTVGQSNRASLLRVQSLSLAEINRVLTEIGIRLDQAAAVGQNPTMHGRRITNVGTGAALDDAATVGQYKGDQVTGKLLGVNAAGKYETKDLSDYIATPDDLITTDDGDGSVTIRSTWYRRFMMMGV